MHSMIHAVLTKAKAGGIALTAAAAIALTGCGGGDTATTVTGQFVDATVVGLGYKCGAATTLTGTTDASGQFTCKTGESVGFYVGGIKLGSVTSAQAMVTPLDLVGAGATPSDPTVNNIVRFLMSISSTDPTIVNGKITIDAAVLTAAAAKTIDFSKVLANDLDTVINAVKPAGANVATSAQAATHMSKSMFGLFAGSFSGSFSGSLSGTWTLTIDSQGGVIGTATDNSNATFPVSGNMATAMGTGSTYAFTGTGGGTPWVGTLNLLTRQFSGTWNDGAGAKGTFTGKAAAAAAPAPAVNSTLSVSGFTPATGAAGGSITITGANLTAVTQVLFTGPSPSTAFVEGAATAKTATGITATVPATLVAGSYTVTVIHPGGEVTAGTFTVSGAAGSGAGASGGSSAGGAGGIGWSSAHVPVCNGVMAAPNTNGALALSWPAVNTATNYQLISTQDDGVTVDPRSSSSLVFDSIGTLNTTATALTDNVSTTAGMVYKYTVQARNGTTFLCGFPQVTVAVGTLPITTFTQQTFTAPRGGNFNNAWPSAATVGTTSAFLIDDGVLVSTGGSTWTKNVPSSGAVGNSDKLAASATTFLIAEGNIVGGTSGINTLRSTDAVTWTAGPSIPRPTGASLGSASVAALTYTNGKFYLAMVYNTTAAAQVMALFSSVDDGATWTALNPLLSGPKYDYGYPVLIVGNSTTLFLHTGGAYRGLYKSTNNGATWAVVSTLDGLPPVTTYTNETRVTSYVNNMFEGEQVIAAGNNSSAIVRFYSADGITWTRASGNGAVVIDSTLRSCSTTGTYFDPAMVATANGQLYTACSKGVVSSTDGINWAYLSRSVPANFTPMAITVNGSGTSARTVLFGRINNSVGTTTGFNLISVP